MTNAADHVLIIGGGFSGMAAAIELRKRGCAVDVVEIDAGWRSYGAGITLSGASLRAFDTLGILDAFLEHGAATDGLDLFLPNGQPIGSVPTPRIAGPDVPATGGIMRPVLARILADATRASGADVRLGCTFTGIAQDDGGVDVTFSDGRRRRYDLVIGADGMYSAVRTAVFPGAPTPQYTGQAVWRAVLPRPADVRGAMMWMGHKVKAGVNPVSADQMYLFVTEDRPTNDRIEPGRFAALLSDLLAPFTAPLIQTIRGQLDASSIVYRPLEGLLMPRPWYRGRVVLIGDTVHATTPHLASGACIGIEDAIVLADELGRHDDLTAALDAFQARRWERCRMVVESSLRLGEIEIHDGDRDEHAGLMGRSMMAMADPI